MTRVLYPGSFDPITKGHMNIIEQANGLFDEVVVACLHNPLKKSGLFTIQERVAMIQEIYQSVDSIRVITGCGASVDIAALYECKAIIRGLRDSRDYDYERQLQRFNKDMSTQQINTVCFFPDSEYQFISSSAVKEVLGLGKDISRYVDDVVAKKLYLKVGGRNNGC